MKLIILMAVIGVAVILIQNICGGINEEIKRYDNQDLIDQLVNARLHLRWCRHIYRNKRKSSITLLTEYRFKLGIYAFIKDTEYLKWMKAKYPHHDLHHIAGSSNVKYTDRLVYPLEHWFHLNSAHKNIPHYFEILLAPSINHYINYLVETNKLSEGKAKYYRHHVSPEDLYNLFELVDKRNEVTE